MASKSSKINRLKDPPNSQKAFTEIKFFEMFWVFLKLGLTCFGGPTAHIGFFHNAFVEQKKWLSAEEYAELVSLCQFLPGPTSSQVGMSIGLKCGGVSKALAAWLGFTLPSMLIMIAAGYGILSFDEAGLSTTLHALKLLAAAVVLQAVISMAKSLTPDWTRKILSFIATIILVANPSALMQILVIGTGVIAGIFLNRKREPKSYKVEKSSARNPFTPFFMRIGPLSATLFFLVLFALPLIGLIHTSQTLDIAAIFFHSGALVFGGGHVVLPLLQSQLVPAGLISHTDFMAGYGIAQAIPGPLFTFAAYLGVFLPTGLPAWLSGVVCVVIIFLPAVMLVLAVIPIWDSVRDNQFIQSALYGINAVVVGLLLAALINPILFLSVKSWIDIALILALYFLLLFSKLPIWLVIFGIGIFGYLWSLI